MFLTFVPYSGFDIMWTSYSQKFLCLLTFGSGAETWTSLQ